MKKFLLLVISISLLIPLNSKINAKSSQIVAPGIALENTKGKFIMLSSLLAKNNLVLSFWSYDCVPCRKEMPELQKMAGSEIFREKNVKVIYIYVEATTEKTKAESKGKTPKEKAIEVLNKLDIQETCLLDIYGVTFNNYRKATKVKKATIPLMYLVNKNKEIVFSAIGYDENSLKKLETAIEKKL